jgi:hypothetical protein
MIFKGGLFSTPTYKLFGESHCQILNVFGGESLSNFYKKFNAIKMKLLQGSLSGI